MTGVSIYFRRTTYTRDFQDTYQIILLKIHAPKSDVAG